MYTGVSKSEIERSNGSNKMIFTSYMFQPLRAEKVFYSFKFTHLTENLCILNS